MAVATYNITLNQGSTFSQSFTFKNASGTAIDLTGYSARAQVRRSAKASDVMIDFSTENAVSADGVGIILIDVLNGIVTLQMQAQHSALLPSFVGVYDLELVHTVDSEIIVERMVAGSFTVDVEVTR